MAVVRNRRALITGVQPFDADEQGRFHLVEVEYTDGVGAETDQVLWEVEPGTEVLEPAALPRVERTAPMDPREFDAMVRAARWSALTPSLPFSGLDRGPPAARRAALRRDSPRGLPARPGAARAGDAPRGAYARGRRRPRQDHPGRHDPARADAAAPHPPRARPLPGRRCAPSGATRWTRSSRCPFDVVDRPQTLKLQRELGVDANPWRTHERIIASYHYLKQPDVLEQFRSTAEPRRGRTPALGSPHRRRGPQPRAGELRRRLRRVARCSSASRPGSSTACS